MSKQFIFAPSTGDLRVTRELSTADLLGCGATPIDLVPAPGVGKAVLPLSCVLSIQSNSVPFTVGSGQPQLGCGLLASFTPNCKAPASCLTDASSGLFSAPGSIAISTAVNWENLPLSLNGFNVDGGPLLTSSKGSGGSGYAPDDTGVLDNGGATYQVLTVDGGGAVLTYSITDPGTFCTVGNGQTTTPDAGGGSGFTINVLTVSSGDGTGTIDLTYRIVDVT